MTKLPCILVGMSAALLFLSGDTVTAHPIEGQWKTFDEKTGEAKSIIDIFVDGERLYGKIVEIFPEEGEDPDPVCEKCPGERRNQKIIGMVIIDGLEQRDGVWSGGKILDPENGKSYRCKLWLEDDELRVRGSLLIFHRTQTWVRATSPPQAERDVVDPPRDPQDAMQSEMKEDSTAEGPE
jgi:uncharacterized protein (DUF2147 family)